MNSWEEHAQTWKVMPVSSSILFFAGVFCLFASLVLIGSSMNFQSQSALDMIGGALIGGGFAIAWAYAGTRRIIWLFFVVGVLQFAAFNVLAWLSGPHHTLDVEEQAHKLRLNGLAEIVLVIAGYVLFILFFNREGARFFRTQTEVRLAGEIHRTLVPARHDTIGKMELFGTSLPSSEVGGDLFDIVRSDGSWHAYVADVSGHGVAAGILMSMIKSTASMQLTKLKKPADLLTDLNDVMQPFTSPANYLTFAYVGGNGTENLTFALAGHLPILHYRAQTKTIIEHSDSNVPIGLFKNQTFEISKLSLLPGDLLAVITDGFTEVFDSTDREIGLDEFKSMLARCAEKPLPEIYRELRSGTMKFGKQTDDQTMLLIRRSA
jgi:serine phosphatase RsbU (regulator of sigma subunit)